MNQLTKRNDLVQSGERKLLAPQLDYFVLDGSSSMSDKWYSLMGALDGYVDVLRASNINSHGVVTTFARARDVGTIALDSPISQWGLLGRMVHFPNESYTALYDAINFMGRDMAHYSPPKAAITIVTDGGENDSRHTDEAQARAILDWCRAQGWQVTFFGCDFDNSSQARALGSDKRHFIGVRKELLKDAAKELGRKRSAYGHGADDIGFDDDEKTKFGGFLGYSGK